MNEPTVPKPKITGIGHIQYRCALCGELMDPEMAVIRDGRAYHAKHLPEKPDAR